MFKFSVSPAGGSLPKNDRLILPAVRAWKRSKKKRKISRCCRRSAARLKNFYQKSTFLSFERLTSKKSYFIIKAQTQEKPLKSIKEWSEEK